MYQNDIVSTFGDIVIEGNRAANAGMGVFQSDGGSAPGSDLDRTRNMLGRQMEIVLHFHQSLVQASDAFLKALFRRDELPHLGGLGFRRGGIQAAAPTEHGFYDLLGNDRSNAAESLPDGVDLEDGAHQILVISRDITGFDGPACGS